MTWRLTIPWWEGRVKTKAKLKVETTITNNNNNDDHWVWLHVDSLGSIGKLPIDYMEPIGNPTQVIMTTV